MAFFDQPDIEPVNVIASEIDAMCRAAWWRGFWTAAATGILAWILAILAVYPAKAEQVDGRQIVIIDGDTVALPGGERVRVLNIDAPESWHSRCDAELVAGLAAKEHLRALLASPVDIQRCETSGRCRDRYGRTLARIIGPDGDIGEIMIREGHALAWAPGPAAKAARLKIWCGGKK